MNVETLFRGFSADNISKIEVTEYHGAAYEVSRYFCIAKGFTKKNMLFHKL